MTYVAVGYRIHGGEPEVIAHVDSEYDDEWLDLWSKFICGYLKYEVLELMTVEEFNYGETT